MPTIDSVFGKRPRKRRRRRRRRRRKKKKRRTTSSLRGSSDRYAGHF
jgi:hypothetical protein